MKIAIAYVDAGLGHRRDAFNLYNAFKQLTKDEVILINATSAEIVGKFNARIWDFTRKIYEFFQRHFFTKYITKSLIISWLMNVYSFMISRKLIDFIKKNKINVFVSTHPLPLIDLCYKKDLKVKLVNIIPDCIDYISAWFYLLPTGPNKPIYFVNDKKSKKILKSLKVENVFVVGHALPLEAEISLSRIDERIKRIEKKKARFLVTTGGAGTNFLEIKKIIEVFPRKKNELIINCNQHAWLFKKLIKECKGRIEGKNIILDRDGEIEKEIGFVYYVSFDGLFCKFLLAIGKNEGEMRENAIRIFNKFFPYADVLVTKPGELALYSCGLPMLLFSPTNVVEITNYKTALRKGYAIRFDYRYLKKFSLKKFKNLYVKTFFGTKRMVRLLRKLGKG
jgi:hypothetical protein